MGAEERKEENGGLERNHMTLAGNRKKTRKALIGMYSTSVIKSSGALAARSIPTLTNLKVTD